MPTPRRIVASLCLPLFLAVGVLCLCRHGAAPSLQESAHEGCASHAGGEAPAPPAGDHAPACSHCGGEELVAASLPGPTAFSAPPALGAAALARALRLSTLAARAPVAAPATLTGRARLARHRVLRV